MYHLDELDKQILAILQEDGRASHVHIARQLGVGHTRVRDRVLRMEEAGVIEGYRAIINPERMGWGVLCIVQLKTDQQYNFDSLAADILAIDEVVEVTNVTGAVDAHIRIWAKDVSHMREILYSKLSALPSHKNTNSTIVLKRWTKPLGLG